MILPQRTQLTTDDGAVERAAAALHAEILAANLDFEDNGMLDKTRLREAARRILWAATDPMWAKR